MSWTPERERKLKELWTKGHTASQIASIIGNTTRNAIIGKAHRLNLEARAISKKSAPKVQTENNITPEVKTQKLGRKARFKALLLDKSFEQENPKKLEELSQQFNISRERVRQIEEKAIEKLQKEISNIT